MSRVVGEQPEQACGGKACVLADRSMGEQKGPPAGRPDGSNLRVCAGTFNDRKNP